MDSFKDGYNFFTQNFGNIYGVHNSIQYVETIEKEINSLVQDLNTTFKGHNTGIDKLKGDIAEYWHSGTHNIDASVKGVAARTKVDRSHDFASADITGSWGESFGLKYYKGAAESAKAQAKTYHERFMEQKTIDIFDEFLKDRGYSNSQIEEILKNPHQTIYEGQTKIIPTDQLQDAISWLEKKIAKESVSRPEQVSRYKDVLNSLQDRIKSPDGSESIPLTKNLSEDIARKAKLGEVTANEFGFNIEEMMQYEYILKQSFKSGMNAATISLVLRVAPEIFKAVEYLIAHGELSETQFQEIGFAALQGGSEGFVRGTISAAITTACQSGLWGTALKSVDPTLIGVATVIMMNTMKNAFYVANGTMSHKELTDELLKDMFVASCSFGMGIIGQGLVEIPVLGFMLGSFVGSMVGSFAYNAGYQVFLSFCVDTGFTMFGLVDQNYELPDKVLHEIGLSIFEYEKFEYSAFHFEEFEHEAFSTKNFEYQTIGITILRRGVIGIRQIGYVC